MKGVFGMVEGKWFAPGTDIGPCEGVRRAVFGRGMDEKDQLSWNVVVWLDGAEVATGRLWWEDGAFWLGDIGVLEDKRGRKLGDLTLRLLLFKAESHAARLLRLVCAQDVAPFFARMGFRPEGEAQDGQVQMMLRGEDLCLDTCKGCKKNCANRK